MIFTMLNLRFCRPMSGHRSVWSMIAETGFPIDQIVRVRQLRRGSCRRLFMSHERSGRRSRMRRGGTIGDVVAAVVQPCRRHAAMLSTRDLGCFRSAPLAAGVVVLEAPLS